MSLPLDLSEIISRDVLVFNYIISLCARCSYYRHSLSLSLLTPPVELTNIQVALQGIENWGFVVASSNITQVFGREHQPVLKEGDLVTKKSWLASVQDLQVCPERG